MPDWKGNWNMQSEKGNICVNFIFVCAQVHWLVHIYVPSITAYYIKMSHAFDL